MQKAVKNVEEVELERELLTCYIAENSGQDKQH